MAKSAKKDGAPTSKGPSPDQAIEIFNDILEELKAAGIEVIEQSFEEDGVFYTALAVREVERKDGVLSLRMPQTTGLAV